MQTPLLLDPLPEHPAETYYLYREATIIDAKKLVVEVVAFLPAAHAHVHRGLRARFARPCGRMCMPFLDLKGLDDLFLPHFNIIIECCMDTVRGTHPGEGLGDRA